MVRRLRGRDIELKSPAQLDAMRAAGSLVADTLRLLTEHAKPGVSTAELDELAEQHIRQAGAVPSFKGYHGFPGSICTSRNERVVHGIPSREEFLVEGDLLSVDCGAILDGWHGDAAVTIEVGEVEPASTRLSAVCREALDAGIRAALAGGRLTDISHAVESSIDTAAAADGVSYGIVADYGGHGIGTEMHMEPFVPNVGRPGRGRKLVPGMALAIEPMITIGTPETTELDDGWTVATSDGSRAAHWEHSIAITDDGPVVLTAPA